MYLHSMAHANKHLVVPGSNLREVQCCHVATGSLIHKNEYPTGSSGYVFE